jgi:hypothetical protein
MGTNNIQFIDYLKPGLSGGTHKLTVVQKTQYNNVATQIESKTQDIFIQAPRFSIDPKEIHMTFPVDNASGHFSNELPFIVFNKRSLPWERFVKDETSNIPWMALISFTEDEVSPVYTMSIGEYISGKRKESGSDNVLIEAIVPLGAIEEVKAEPNYNADATCQCIEISLETFQKLVPQLANLKYFAHCREVPMDNKADIDMLDKGKFSTILSNRAAQSGRNIVHLVSLEGCEKYLENNFSGDVTKKIRLLSLTTWSFNSMEGLDIFETQIKNLLQKDGDDFLLRIKPEKQLSNSLDTRFKAGYIPLPYHASSGEENFAWYRGPLVPAKVEISEEVYTSASSAMLFDESTGTFDVTYSAAWQLGRSLTLANQNLGPMIMNFMRNAHSELHKIIHLSQNTSELMPLNNLMGNYNNASPEITSLNAEPNMTQPSDNQLTDSLQQLFNINTAQTLLANIFKDKETEGIKPRMGSPDAMAYNINGFSIPEKTIIKPLPADNVKGLLDQIKNWSPVTNYQPMEDSAPTALNYSAEESPAINTTELVSTILTKFGKDLRNIFSELMKTDIDSIPFYYLIPHTSLLPNESMRFFYIDTNWWNAFYGGALSIGIHTSIDETFYHLVGSILNDTEKQLYIETQLEITFPERSKQWGLLLRSDIVIGWKGVEFYVKDNTDTILNPIISKQLANDMLLFLFADEPVEIEIHEPKEGIRFSVAVDDIDQESNCINISELVRKNNVGESSGVFAQNILKKPKKVVIKHNT